MLKIRPFNPTNREYETLVEIMNSHNPHHNFTADEWREFDQVIVSKGSYARFVGEVDDQIVAVSSYGQPPRLRGTAKYLLELALRPEYEREALVESLYGHLMDILESRNAIAVLTETDESNLGRIHFLEEKRFELVQRDYYSRLELATFDLTPHLSIMKKMQEHHITIYNLAYLHAHDPDWFSKLEELHWQVRQDIPSSEPPVRESTDQYRKRFERSSFRADAWFVAIDERNGQAADGHYVGHTQFWIEPNQPDMLRTGQTGVVRSHRRRGIATALKLRALEFAKQVGVKTITTSNEENNPMLQINLALGFKPDSAWLKYRKILVPLSS